MSPVTGTPFSLSHDSVSKIVTSAVVVVFLVIAGAVHSVTIAGFTALLLVAAYAWSPAGCSIRDGAVVVERLIGDVKIPLAGIREVRIATADDLCGCIRLFGSGGLFGYYGVFRTSRLGKSIWYVTNRRHLVVIVSDSGTAMLSPDDAEGFVSAVRTASRIVPAISVSFPAPAGLPQPGSGRVGWKKAAVLIPVAVVVTVSMFYAPGPPAYTLTRESLTIHDRFYPVTLNAASVDVASARVIDFDRDTDWKPVVRTNGFANARYHSGWFRVASGKVVRLYRADAARVVLLPPKGAGTPVLLETKEPEKFLADLQRNWAGGS